MNKAELEKKSLSDLHSMAAEAGIPRYRMLGKLAGGNGDAGAEKAPKRGTGEGRAEKGERSERPRRRRREPRERTERRDRPEKAPEREPAPEPARAPAAEPTPAPTPAAAQPPRPRRRRRRRLGRRSKAVSLPGLLLPPEAGRRARRFAETRAGCSALLRGV